MWYVTNHRVKGLRCVPSPLAEDAALLVTVSSTGTLKVWVGGVRYIGGLFIEGVGWFVRYIGDLFIEAVHVFL